MPAGSRGSWAGLAVMLLFVAVAGAGLWWVGGSGAGPDRQCRIVLSRDGSWYPKGWEIRTWPVRDCNWVVHNDTES